MKKFIALLMAIVGLACSGVLAIADSHNWNEGEWIQLPSCSVQGQRKYTCTNPGCDAQYVEQVGMLEHFFLPATCTDKPICQWCKRPKKGSKELGHIKPEAACVEQKCQRVDCDKVYPATNNAHHFRPATCDSPEICRDCRIKQGQALGHDFTAATCKSPATCTRCNKTEGAKKHMCIFLPLAPSLPHAGIAVRRPALTKTITSRMASVPFAISRSTRWTMSRTKKMT